MKILLIISFILISSCGQIKKDAPVYVQTEFLKTYKVFGPSTKKRIFLTHGVWADDTVFDSGDLKSLKDGLISKGFQVITFTYPYTSSGMFLDQGKYYRKIYKNFLEWAIEDTNEKYGSVTELDIGGFSFGGLHAIIGASMLPFNKYIAMLPVTSPRDAYIFGSIEDFKFNAFYEIDSIKNKKGIVTTSHADSILGFVNAKNFSYLSRSKYKDYFGINGHNTSSQMIVDILEWI